jgi:cytochrome c biogenesis protein ResB
MKALHVWFFLVGAVLCCSLYTCSAPRDYFSSAVRTAHQIFRELGPVTNRAAERKEHELQQALHVGQSKEEVEATLKILEIEHSFDTTHQQFVGMLRDVTTGMVSRSVHILIHIGADDKVTKLTMSDVLTGP